MTALSESPAADTDAPSVPPTRAPALGETRRVDPEARRLEVTLATPRRDRQGDIVEPAGLDFSHFMKNPVVLWAHDLAAPPVGRVLAVRKEAQSVEATILFAETRFAREVFSLYAEGFLRAWSLGFLPREWERLPGTHRGFRIREAEVVEVSAVPVPANPEALTRALRTAEDARVLRALRTNAPAETPAAGPECRRRRLRSGRRSGCADAHTVATRCAEETERLVPRVLEETLRRLRGRLA